MQFFNFKGWMPPGGLVLEHLIPWSCAVSMIKCAKITNCSWPRPLGPFHRLSWAFLDETLEFCLSTLVAFCSERHALGFSISVFWLRFCSGSSSSIFCSLRNYSEGYWIVHLATTPRSQPFGEANVQIFSKSASSQIFSGPYFTWFWSVSLVFSAFQSAEDSAGLWTRYIYIYTALYFHVDFWGYGKLSACSDTGPYRVSIISKIG